MPHKSKYRKHATFKEKVAAVRRENPDYSEDRARRIIGAAVRGEKRKPSRRVQRKVAGRMARR